MGEGQKKFIWNQSCQVYFFEQFKLFWDPFYCFQTLDLLFCDYFYCFKKIEKSQKFSKKAKNLEKKPSQT